MTQRLRVLDASALLAALLMEPGGEVVAQWLEGAVISAVNLSEVVANLAKKGMPEAEIRHDLGVLCLDVRPFTPEQAFMAGLMRPATVSRGLSFGDRACLALATTLGAVALTSDHAWAGMAGVELIR
jgi:PIN domain nuclease of toxin-antitoxin system